MAHSTRLANALIRARETIARVERHETPHERAKSAARRKQARIAEIMQTPAPVTLRAAPAPSPPVRTAAAPLPASRKEIAKLSDAAADTIAREIVDLRRERKMQSAKIGEALAKLDLAIERASK